MQGPLAQGGTTLPHRPPTTYPPRLPEGAPEEGTTLLLQHHMALAPWVQVCHFYVMISCCGTPMWSDRGTLSTSCCQHFVVICCSHRWHAIIFKHLLPIPITPMPGPNTAFGFMRNRACD